MDLGRITVVIVSIVFALVVVLGGGGDSFAKVGAKVDEMTVLVTTRTEIPTTPEVQSGERRGYLSPPCDGLCVFFCIKNMHALLL